MSALANPLVQSVALPAAVAVACIALGRYRVLRSLACAVLVGAMLVCLLTALGMAPWPPRTGLHRLTWTLIALIAFAPVLFAQSRNPRVRGLAAGLVAVAALLATASSSVTGAGAGAVLALAAVLAMALSARLAAGPVDTVTGVALLGAAALGLAVVATLAASLVLAQLAGALAVACGVIFVWGSTGRSTRVLLAAPGLGAAAAFALGSLVVLLTDARSWALLLLAGALLADRAVPQRVPSRWRPAVAGALALLPVAVAVLATQLSLPVPAEDDAYY